jgi:tetratricopeptide (TPR) repeat protein
VTGGIDRIERARTGGGDWHLHDERELLQRSLEDAALEHLAGDLSDEDYALLRARDKRRLAEVDAALEAQAWAVAPARGEPRRAPRRTAHAAGRVLLGRRVRWRRRWWVAAAGVVAVLAAIVLLVVDLTSPRLPGTDATGSITLNTAQTIERQLGQAKSLVANGRSTQALQLYGDVLAEDPRQPVALAEWGWLDWRAGTSARERTVAAEGASALEEAVKVDPQLFAAQYYLGAVLYEEGAAHKAVTHFAKFLADKPTAKWLRDAAAELRAAYGAAHEPVPAGLPAGG